MSRTDKSAFDNTYSQGCILHSISPQTYGGGGGIDIKVCNILRLKQWERENKEKGIAKKMGRDTTGILLLGIFFISG